MRASCNLNFIQWVRVNRLICLIGNNKKKGAGSKAGDMQQAAVTVNKDELRDIRKKTEKGLKSDAIVIT